MDKKKIMCAAAVLTALMLLAALLWGNNVAGRTHNISISEIMCSNTFYPNNDGICCDWIELYNYNSHDVSLGGMSISCGKSSYTIPADTKLGGNEYLVIYCAAGMTGTDCADLSLSSSGNEEIRLLNKKGTEICCVTTIAVNKNESIVYDASGSGTVSQTPSPGCAAGEYSLSLPYNSGVRISEYMSDNRGVTVDGEYTDWVELVNFSGDDADISGWVLTDRFDDDRYVFPEGSKIPAGGFLVIKCVSDGDEGFAIDADGGEHIWLKDVSGAVVDIVEINALGTNETYALNDKGEFALCVLPTPGEENIFTLTTDYQGGYSVRINEIMACNESTLPDGSGAFPDWIELYNAGDEPVDLSYWTLSDDLDAPEKYTLPQTEIGAGEYLVIFCDGSGETQNGEIHASFMLSEKGETLVLCDSRGLTQDKAVYGRLDGNESAILTVAGEYSVCTEPTPGYANDDAGREAFLDAQKPAGALAIWEFMGSNDKYLPQDGNCYDWVELKNVSGETIKLSDYCISDDKDTRDKFCLPDKELEPGESYIVLLSGDESLTGKYCHAGFKLCAAGDALYVYSSDGRLSDFAQVPHIPNGCSMGRQEDDGGYFYMAEPTPGATNCAGYRKISDEPQGTYCAGVYTLDSTATVSFTNGGEIYYTLDGSDPTEESTPYDGTIDITKTCVLRAIRYESGKLYSDIYTATFIINDPHYLPVVSLVTDPDNLWGKDGIYKNSTDTKKEKRAANLSYEGDDGSFSIDCEISMHGQTSLLAQSKKSFTVRFQNNYDGPLNYDVFGDGNVSTFYSLVLRADQESTYSSYMRDNLMAYTAINCSDNLMAMNTKYVALFIDGEYWGIYSIREHYSVEYYASHVNADPDSVIMIKGYPVRGTSIYSIKQYCLNHNLAKQECYDYVKTQLNIDSFIDWIIFESYVGNIDIYSNMRYLYCPEEGLWRCGLVDVDLGMFQDGTYEKVTESLSHGAFMESLFDSGEFRLRFAERLNELMTGPMSDESMTESINKLAAIIRPEVPLEKERWGGTTRQWESMVNSLLNYVDGRASRMVKDGASLLGFGTDMKKKYFPAFY